MLESVGTDGSDSRKIGRQQVGRTFASSDDATRRAYSLDEFLEGTLL